MTDREKAIVMAYTGTCMLTKVFTFSDGTKKIVKYENNTFRESILNKFMKKE